MAEWFASDIGHTNNGYITSLRAQIAVEIVKHCALVSGYPDGEDTAGRAKVGLMPAHAVAARANAVANALVEEWENKGWIRPTTMTPEEDWVRVGQLHGYKLRGEYPPASPEEIAAREARQLQRVKERLEREKAAPPE